ncbi:MAG: alkaline phosphatase [Chitinispirillales bacterium]|jgi:alkaline phosphatase|nr:alkaline phosphatase [Chitinispirillales bacterium]
MRENRTFTGRFFTSALCAAALALISCAGKQRMAVSDAVAPDTIALYEVTQDTITQDTAVQEAVAAETVEPAPKYVFLFIGDGMGFSHIAAAEAYLAASTGSIGNVSLSFTEFPTMGMATTYSANSYITCSSAAGTALSTGVKTDNNRLNVTPEGETLRSIAYDLQDAGYRIGIATSVSIDHATPAAFFASDTSRGSYYNIAAQLAPSGFDFFAGSGFLQPVKEVEGSEENIYAQIQQAGYAVVRTPEELEQAPASSKMVMVQEEEHDNAALVIAVNRKNTDGHGWTLADFTRTGIDRLTDSAGFFFMVEGGQIDWMAHNNDAVALIYEVIDFSKAIELAIEFYKKHPDETLIVVTADHETGGLALGYYTIPYELHPTPEVMHTQTGRTPLNTDEEKLIKALPVVRELSGQSGFSWTTAAHTGGAVPVFAIGAGSERFRGKMDNTDIPKRIRELMIRE